MAIVVTIGGTDRTSSVDLKTVKIHDGLGMLQDSCQFDVAIGTTDGWNPQAGNEIVVLNGTTREFAGMLLEVDEDLVAPSRLRYRLGARDYKHLFDRRLVAEEYAEQAANSIVSSIVTSFTTGFTTINVMAAPTVAAQRFDYIAPSDVLDHLAATVGYLWYIDYDRDVNFFSAATLAAPIATLNADTDTTNYGNLQLRESIAHVKTRMYVMDFKQKSTATYTVNFTGDGSTKLFHLTYEPSALADMTVTRAAATQTLHTDMVDGQPDNAIGGADDVYVNFEEATLRWDTAPAAGNAIVATFNYLYPGFTVFDDPAAQTEVSSREGGDGIHEAAVRDPGLSANDGSETLANSKAAEAIARAGLPRLEGSFVSFTQGWAPGQMVTVASTQRMGGISVTMYVTSIDKRIVSHPSGGSPTFHYNIRIADRVYT